jgi:hypothetical protein
VKRADRAALEQRYTQQRSEARFTMVLAALSVSALLYYYAKQQLLLYGDAVAHLNIARRVVDNRHPIASYGQLGTVWLPLQHIAMLPFVWVNTLWQSGIAGAIPGMLAFVLGTLGIYRLVSARAGKSAAYLAAVIYALNPNLLYMQSTAMNEPIALAFFIWSLVFLDEFLRAVYPPAPESQVAAPQLSSQKALEFFGITMYAGALTRYDGWFSATVLGLILIALFVRWCRQTANAQQRRAMTKSFVEVLLLNALVPVYWLVYTWAVSGNALDFINGPYSAKAIALRSTAKGAPPYPGERDILTSALYFLKSAQLNVGSPFWGRVLLLLAIIGTAAAVWRFRRFGILLLLWLPLAFYALSIAYLHSRVVAVLVLQRALRSGTAAGFRRFSCACANRPTREIRRRTDEAGDGSGFSGNRRGQLHLGLCREADHVARGRDELSRPQFTGTRIGTNFDPASPEYDAADVRGRACRSAASGGHSIEPRNLRSRASRLGVGTTGPSTPRGLRHRLQGRSGVGCRADARQRFHHPDHHLGALAGELHRVQAKAR